MLTVRVILKSSTPNIPVHYVKYEQILQVFDPEVYHNDIKM